MLVVIVSFATMTVAQTTKWRDMYKVKKKDTIFGIAKKYNISIPELMDANPEMKVEGYELKKGDYIFIPFEKPKEEAKSVLPQPADDVKGRAIRVGIMLPLHDVDGDGRRMVEYYRGVLMACDSLKARGISTDVHAWNVPIDADIRQTLLAEGANKCDIIFGPLYTTQVKALGDFCTSYNIKMVIPFSINGDEVTRNPQIFQVYQSPDRQNNEAIELFKKRFVGYHPVFIDCNDSLSQKGVFTSALRNQLDAQGVKYNITNLNSPEANFSKAFSRTQPNVVILNTQRSPQLNIAIEKINGVVANAPAVKVSLFGYTQWFLYTKNQLENFFKYDTYIPTVFYYNPLSRETRQFEDSYRRWFKTDMQYALPRFAITGYDQAQFFIRGIYKYGKAFTGAREQNDYKPLQTPLNFKRIGNGGMQNCYFMLINYTPQHNINSIQ